jgi:MFS transporter, DHA2 family, glioxin efflux transporter
MRQLTLPSALTQIVSGVIIGEVGIFNPFLIIGAILTAVGCGMLTTLEVNSGSAEWIGYQILTGIGEGLCLNVPIIVTQRIADPKDVPVATAVVLCKSS